MGQDTTRPPSTQAARAAETGDCSCAEARAHLEAFLDQECAADLSERLARHVATCPHCSQVADAERHLRAILRSRCAEQAPASLRERVMERLSTMRQTPGGTVVAKGSVTVRSVSVEGSTTTTVTTVESLTYRRG